MLVQEETATIFTDPRFLEVVRELLTPKKEPPPVEDEGAELDEDTRRIRRMILYRMKKRQTKG